MDRYYEEHGNLQVIVDDLENGNMAGNFRHMTRRVHEGWADQGKIS